MSDNFDPKQEAELRGYLHATIRPPRTPDRIRLRIESMDAAVIPAARPMPALPAWLRHRAPALRTAGAVGLTIVLVAGLVVVWQSRPSVSTTPASAATATPSQVDSISTGTDLASGVISDGGGFVYVEGYGLRVTTDYGSNWSEARQVPVSDSVEDHLWDVETLEFYLARRGWMLGVTNGPGGSEITSYRTIDGGVSWQASHVASWPAESSSSGSHPRIGGAQHFVDAKRGWVVFGPDQAAAGDQSCRRFSTADGGVTWTGPETVLCAGPSTFIHWTSEDLGYIGPDASASGGKLWTTVDGGWTWHSGSLPGVGPSENARTLLVVEDGAGRLNALVRIGQGHGIVGLASGESAMASMFESADDGRTWSKTQDIAGPRAFTLAEPTLPPSYRFESMQALTSTDWVATFRMSSANGPLTVLETWNGESWTGWNNAYIPSNGETLWWSSQMGFNVAAEPYCCGDAPAIYVTSDSGRDWNREPF